MVSHVCPPESFQLLLCLFLLFLSVCVCGQALERQKEYFDCVRSERDELRGELSDIKGKAKAGEVRLPKGNNMLANINFMYSSVGTKQVNALLLLCFHFILLFNTCCFSLSHVAHLTLPAVHYGTLRLQVLFIECIVNSNGAVLHTTAQQI